MLVLAACGGGDTSSGGGDKKETLVIVDWGGSVTEARETTIFEPFEEEFNVKIEVESPTDYGKLKAMVEGGNVDWDVVNVDTFWAAQAGEEGLLEKIDYDIVDKEDIIPEVANEYSMGAEMFSVANAYNTEDFSEDNHAENWEAFWDVDEFPGNRAFYNDPAGTFEIALLADGVKPEELYPLDVDRALESLEKLREKTDIIWWDTGAEPAELLSTGSASFSSAWNGRIIDAKDQDVPVDLEYNQAILASESWVVPKGTGQKDLAMEFIEFATSAEVQADFANTIDYSPVNEKAIELLPEDVQKRLGQSPELAENQIIMDTEYWAENYEEVIQKFQEWHLE